jgi:hypothetical protein
MFKTDPKAVDSKRLVHRLDKEYKIKLTIQYTDSFFNKKHISPTVESTGYIQALSLSWKEKEAMFLQLYRIDDTSFVCIPTSSSARDAISSKLLSQATVPTIL